MEKAYATCYDHQKAKQGESTNWKSFNISLF